MSQSLASGATKLVVPVELGMKDVRIHWDENNRPWFAMTDVAESLGLLQPAHSARQFREELTEGEECITTTLLDARGCRQKTYVMTEEALLEYVLWSRAEKCRAFRKWAASAIKEILTKGSYSLPGVKLQPAETPETRFWARRLNRMLQEHRCYLASKAEIWGHSAFTVVTAIAQDVIWLEDELDRHLLPTYENSRPDQSVGQRYASHRRAEGQQEVPADWKAPFRYAKDGKQATIMVNVYPGLECECFLRWFREHYLPSQSVEYLAGTFHRHGDSFPQACVFSAADNLCRISTTRRVNASAGMLEAIDKAPERRILVSSLPKQAMLEFQE